MGAALEVVSGRASAPSTTFTAWTLASGNSLTVRNAPLDSGVWLLQLWHDNQTAGVVRVRSPNLHDNVQGIRCRVSAGYPAPLLPWGVATKLIPQDLLVVEATGSATAGDLEQGALLIYYANLPGVDARFITYEQVIARRRHIVTVENSLATGTGGGYSGEEALNAEFDLLKANTDYAFLGYLVDTECAVVRWRGADTGNLGIGGPGEPDLRELTSLWFVKLSQMYGLPLIPVFNASNKAGILLDAAQDEDGADVVVTTILCELAPAT